MKDIESTVLETLRDFAGFCHVLNHMYGSFDTAHVFTRGRQIQQNLENHVIEIQKIRKSAKSGKSGKTGKSGKSGTQ